MQEVGVSGPRFSLSHLPLLPQLVRSLRRWTSGHWLVVVAGGVAVGVIAAAAVVLLRQSARPLLPLRIVADLPLSGGTSRFDYQSLDPLTHRLFVAHLGAGIITVVDVSSDQVVANIPDVAGVHGVLAVPELGRVYASATDAHQIVVIDEQSLQVVRRIPGGDYPDGLAYAPLQHELFVSDEAGGADVVIDVTTNRQVATIPLGGEAGNTQYDPVSGRIYVDVQTRNELAAIDPATHTIVARYPLAGCEHDHSLLIDAPQRLAFIACDGNATLLVMDLGSMRVLSTQSVGDGVDVLALDHGTHLLYSASESGVVSVFDEHGRAVRKVGEGYVAPEAHSVAVDEATHRIFLPLQDVNGRPVLRIAQFQPRG
jgi:DNA-binding beta-propeller fold protein YncE